ncbi:MAG: C69 family dipeptidase [Spirochaetaceae bacterium]|nr:C69 family dipeptidase [Spirochaetaceae bacterium]
MKSLKMLVLALVIFALSGLDTAFACTTTIVTKGASADGSVMVSHSDDGHIEGDSSVVFVPAKTFDPAGSRAIYAVAVAVGDLPEYHALGIPRLVLDDGPEAYRHPGLPRSLAIGAVPYRDILGFLGDTGRTATYSYLEANYGIVNEWGVMFGECTNSAKIEHMPVPQKRIFYSSELSQLALEHCKTARDAVRLIGHLIEVYGYWGTGETLPVADADEAWVIEMAPVPEDYTGANGLWVAQLVPDGEFFIAANEFRIREIDPAKRNLSQMYGDKLFDITRELGWRTVSDEQSGLMDWLATVSLGEYSHPYYSLRRVWRGLSLAAPSLNLSPWVKDGKRGLTRQYPFSVVPDKKLTLADLRAMHRDHYEGTEFDLTKGTAAGPWGNPNRYLGTNDPDGDIGDPQAELTGAWERPIGVYYTNITYINQMRPDMPYPINIVSWIALNASAESTFVPLAVAPPPPNYEVFDSRVFNLDGQAWRIFNLVGQYANLKYSFMINDINAAQAKHEGSADRMVPLLQAALAPLAKENPAEALVIFSDVLNANAMTIQRSWHELFETLVLNYNQGDVNHAQPGEARRLGRTRYHDDWLEATDYFRGPTTYKKKRGGD